MRLQTYISLSQDKASLKCSDKPVNIQLIIINIHANVSSWDLWAELQVQYADILNKLLNEIIHPTLSAAKVPSRLKPPGFSRSDGN